MSYKEIGQIIEPKGKEDLSKTIMIKIIKSIPSNIKPVYFLMETLEIGKEAAYRRLRNQVPFTIEELAVLSRVLKFSLDEMIGGKTGKNTSIHICGKGSSRAPLIFLAILNDYHEALLHMSRSNSHETIVSLNRLLIYFGVGYDYLFRFFYYKWMQQLHEVPLNFYFSDVEIPANIKELNKDINSLQQLVNDTTLILDQHIFLNLIREVQYYYKRKLISDEERSAIKAELEMLIDSFEKNTQRGSNGTGRSISIYLSSLPIDSNGSYIRYDNTVESNFFIHASSPLKVLEPSLCSMQKKWLESLKKYSVLITQSNEILQSEFFHKQKEYLTILSTEETL